MRPGARYAQGDRLSGYPVDLREEEARGGHTIQEHVGKSPAYLLARVQRERQAEIERGDDAQGLRIGSFTSLDSATRLVNSTIAQNRDIVDRVASGESRGEQIEAQFASPTGYEAYARSSHSVPYIRETDGVRVIIAHDPSEEKGYRVYNAFPKNFR